MRGVGPGILEAAVVLIAGSLVAASWQWGYQAAARAYWRDRGQMALLTERISQVHAMVQAAGGEAAWLSRQQQRLVALKARFPQQAQVPQLLNTLIDGLKAGEMKLVNVTQGNLEPVQEGGTPLVVEGVPYHRLPVTVTGEGRYLAVLATLERLTGDAFPGVVGIGHVELRLKEPTGSKLDATLQLFLYVSGTPTARPPNG